MFDLLQNAVLQGLTFGVAVLGLAIAFRVARYPDLTGDGAFMIGASLFAAVVRAGHAWPLALTAAGAGGGLAGLLTSELHRRFQVNRLLTGILTSMAAYSLAFRALGGRANVGLVDRATMFPFGAEPSGQLGIAAAAAVGLGLAAWWLLRSELGLVLRAAGSNPNLVRDLGRRPPLYTAIALALANGLIAVSGALVAAQQGFADINMSVGAIITFVASLAIGEEVVRRLRRTSRLRLAELTAAPFLGATLYFLFYLVILRLSLQGLLPLAVQPTDLKLLSAIMVVIVLALRRHAGRVDDMVPL